MAFIDLPTREEKDVIWQLYRGLYGLEDDQQLPHGTDYTGAEIKACCRLAALLDQPLIQAAQNVVPVAVTSAEAVGRLRTWASGRCMDAREGDIYQAETKDGKRRRKVWRGDPSLN